MTEFLPTAGAVPVRNERGVLVMQKVKVKRYVPGKRPDYAPRSDDEEEDEVVAVQKAEDEPESAGDRDEHVSENEDDTGDHRLLRLLQLRRANRAQRLEEADGRRPFQAQMVRRRPESSDDEAPPIQRDDIAGSEGEDEDEEEAAKRRGLLRLKALARRQKEEEVEIIARAEADQQADEASDEERSDYDEVSETDEEEGEDVLLKPVFVRKEERHTVKSQEKIEAERVAVEQEKARMLEERRKESHAMLAQRVEGTVATAVSDSSADEDEVSDGDGDEQDEYEKWKVRELARVRRDREVKETKDKEQSEVERRRTMVDDELKAEAKHITNQAPKGRYKFLQKYYHRGAFFVSEKEEVVYQRDISQATGMDRVDKTILPKVMQVKNFGRAGRTKWTHLTAEDTTSFESPWAENNPQNLRTQQKLGGFKSQFTRPTTKKNTK